MREEHSRIPKVTLFTKPNCHLCDEMKVVLKNVRSKIEFELNEVNIESDRELFEKYKDKIPVLTIDGKLFAKYRVDEEKLRARLHFKKD